VLRLLRRLRVQRYANPNLHEGAWGPPTISRGKVTWLRLDEAWLRQFIGPHAHQSYVCTIGPGMAHIDACPCGAKRYGVFGAWSS
jgi:hypothetical protein